MGGEPSHEFFVSVVFQDALSAYVVNCVDNKFVAVFIAMRPEL